MENPTDLEIEFGIWFSKLLPDISKSKNEAIPPIQNLTPKIYNEIQIMELCCDNRYTVCHITTDAHYPPPCEKNPSFLTLWKL